MMRTGTFTRLEQFQGAKQVIQQAQAKMEQKNTSIWLQI